LALRRALPKKPSPLPKIPLLDIKVSLSLNVIVCAVDRQSSSILICGAERATYGIYVPRFLHYQGKDLVVKAQVLAGGRGLGTFANGFKSGVHMVKTYAYDSKQRIGVIESVVLRFYNEYSGRRKCGKSPARCWARGSSRNRQVLRGNPSTRFVLTAPLLLRFAFPPPPFFCGCGFSFDTG
jgi:hypothetical protein